MSKVLKKHLQMTDQMLLKPLNLCFIGKLVVLGFNATLTAKVISWRSVMHTCFLAFSHRCQHNFSFQNHRLLFSHASAEVSGENTPERKVASTGDQTRNHQVTSPTRSPLSHPCRAFHREEKIVEKEKMLVSSIFFFSDTMFSKSFFFESSP